MPYRFLLDEDVSAAANLFPSGRVRTLEDVGLSHTVNDRQIVEAACESECIIVTGNRRDFEREILRFQKLTKRKDCHELWGLIVLPNGLLRQKRLLKDAEKRLRFQDKSLRWGDVWRGNYYVRITRDGRPQVMTRFPRCLYCVKQQQKDEGRGR